LANPIYNEGKGALFADAISRSHGIWTEVKLVEQAVGPLQLIVLPRFLDIAVDNPTAFANKSGHFLSFTTHRCGIRPVLGIWRKRPAPLQNGLERRLLSLIYDSYPGITSLDHVYGPRRILRKDNAPRRKAFKRTAYGVVVQDGKPVATSTRTICDAFGIRTKHWRRACNAIEGLPFSGVDDDKPFITPLCGVCEVSAIRAEAGTSVRVGMNQRMGDRRAVPSRYTGKRR
jgi:hypothetical protein